MNKNRRSKDLHSDSVSLKALVNSLLSNCKICSGQKTKIKKFAFKKSFEIYCQILFKVLIKVGINFVHFACVKMKPLVNVMFKKAQPIKGSTETQPNKIRHK
jgi:hypothetical protein